MRGAKESIEGGKKCAMVSSTMMAIRVEGDARRVQSAMCDEDAMINDDKIGGTRRASMRNTTRE